MTCSNCGQENPPGFLFCGRCGQPLVPPAGGPGEERKVVTVLFADVTGSTALGERLDPERLKDVMGAYFDAMREEIEAEGGTVEKFIGDAVMAVFGVPATHEDDPARALRAAGRMLSRLEVLNVDLSSRHEVELQIRVGVNTGEVIAASAPRPGEAMVSGDAVNVAARLEQSARPGSVVVSERTARATRGFVFRPLGSLELRGKGRGVPAFELAGERTAAPERGIPGLRAPMVGRDEELALLRSIYSRAAAEGRPHLVTVFGDAGIGKSRLTAEFLGWAESTEPPALALRGRCLPYGEGVTYWPLAEILKGHAGVLDTDPPDAALGKIRKLGQDLLTPEVASDPDRATAALAYTVGVEDPSVDFRSMAPRQVRAEVHAAWRSFFSALATSGPVVVLVEDVHWADPALLDLLEDLSDRAQGPVIVVCPSRPELIARRPGWGGGRRSYSSIFLEPLTPEDAQGLVRLLLTVEDLPRPVRDRILERAEGNPFYLEEIIRGLIDAGRISRDGERWRAAEDIADVQIPDTVQGVLAARIDLLDPGDKRVLQLAAVVGRVFWTGPVLRLLGDGDAESLTDAIERLQDRELVLARLGSSMAGQQELIFKHVLTREVAYGGLPRRDRVQAHAEVARWIEDTAGERRDEFVELLAHHYTEAHRGAREDGRVDDDTVERLRRGAFDALLRASLDARSKMAVSKARRLAGEAAAVASTPEERASALEALGLINLTDYQGDMAYRAFRDAAELRAAKVPEDRLALARVCSRALESPTRWPGSMRNKVTQEEAERYLSLGFDANPPEDSEERVRLLTAQGFWSFAFPDARNEGGYRKATQAAQQALAMAARMGRVDLELAALDSLGSVTMIQGLYGGLSDLLARRLELVAGDVDPQERGDTYANAAWNSADIGRYRDAVRYGVEGAERTISEMPGVAIHCLARASVARFALGEWDELLAGLDQMMETMGDRRDSPPPFALMAYAAAAVVHDARGDRAMADRLLEVVERSGPLTVGGGPAFDTWVAMTLGRRGNFDEAFERVDRHVHLPAARPLAYAVRCDLVADAGRWDEAEGFVAEALAWADHAGLEALPQFARRLAGRAALAGGDAAGSVDLLRSAGSAFRQLEAGWELARTELYLAEALIAAGLDAAEPVRDALATFERLGALHELAEARDLAEGTGV